MGDEYRCHDCSLVYLLKGIIILRFEIVHRTVIGVDRDLFFVVRFE